MLTAGTLLALVVAVIAFVVLKPAGEDAIPRDTYTLAAEKICLNAKQQIVNAEQSAVEDAREGRQAMLAQHLVSIVATWRTEMTTLKIPSDRREEAGALDSELRAVEIEIAKLGRVADSGGRARIAVAARRVDRQTARVEAAVEGLGLEECAHETITLAHPRA